MIKYYSGNVLANIPQDATVLIPHCLSDVGAYGAGVAAAIARRFPKARNKYMEWFSGEEADYTLDSMGEIAPFELGSVQLVEVQSEPNKVFICNMIGQQGLVSPTNPTPVKYDALRKAMTEIAKFAKWFDNCKILTIPFGSGLAGGDFKIIEKDINEIWADIDVSVYDINRK